MREMKDSGVQWIGEIPKTWSVSKVGMFYEVVLGKMLSLRCKCWKQYFKIGLSETDVVFRKRL